MHPGEESCDGSERRDQRQAQEQGPQAAAGEGGSHWLPQRGQVCAHKPSPEQARLRERAQAGGDAEPKVAAPWWRPGPA